MSRGAERGAEVDETEARQPTLRDVFAVDVATYDNVMGGPLEVKEGLPLAKEAARVAWVTDAFLAVLLYRIRVRLLVHHVPVLPPVLHRLCKAIAQLDIGDDVVVEPGVYFPHGQVVIHGKVDVGRGTVIAPWVTIDGTGTTRTILSSNVLIGTGATIVGPVRLGDQARVGANAVVTEDVRPLTTVAGNPARVVRDRWKEALAADPEVRAAVAREIAAAAAADAVPTAGAPAARARGRDDGR